MDYSRQSALGITRDSAVVTVSMNHPPLHMLDSVLITELKRFVREAVAAMRPPA
jgi:hypothetical protein